MTKDGMLDKKSSNNRQSGIELLRIFAMFGVIILHYNSEKAFVWVETGGINYYIIYLLESLCICAVDLFIIIAGFFLCKTQKRSVSKALELTVQVIIFSEAWYMLNCLVEGRALYLKSIVLNLVPRNYYLILYITLYIISPYLNVIVEYVDKCKLWKKFMFTIMIIFSVWPTLVDLSGEVLNIQWMGLSSIGAWGNQQGFNIVNFVLCYFVGTVIRYKNFELNKSGLISICVVLLGMIFTWSLVNEHTVTFGLRSAWCYHNPLVICMAATLFVFFKELKFYKPWINEFAKATFTCFILHGKLLPLFNIKGASEGTPLQLILHIIMVAISIFAISYLVYKIYTFIMEGFFKIMRPIINKIDISLL